MKKTLSRHGSKSSRKSMKKLWKAPTLSSKKTGKMVELIKMINSRSQESSQPKEEPAEAKQDSASCALPQEFSDVSVPLRSAVSSGGRLASNRLRKSSSHDVKSDHYLKYKKARGVITNLKSLVGIQFRKKAAEAVMELRALANPFSQTKLSHTEITLLADNKHMDENTKLSSDPKLAIRQSDVMKFRKEVKFDEERCKSSGGHSRAPPPTPVKHHRETIKEAKTLANYLMKRQKKRENDMKSTKTSGARSKCFTVDRITRL